MISLIWAQDLKKGIGIDNLLPWNIKEEMQHFRNTTVNQIVVMGQRTFESIGNPLVNRTNVILSDDLNFKIQGAVVYHDVKKILSDFKNEHLFIVGGKAVYELFAPFADELIVSKIKKVFPCNRFLNINFDNYKLVKSQLYNEFVVEWWNRNK